ncbi:MAG: Gfo/Idh/MocA family oxidoreductase [Candidatus Hydrogenedens sp.]|jgi:predicted dehydrogenase/threonine dehydrogenase-like Zn-dependent dehydrogenase|nr:Gfo/Idh/MocA family oxidoreductase [Candidatus Hydrogenedens sp.]
MNNALVPAMELVYTEVGEYVALAMMTRTEFIGSIQDALFMKQVAVTGGKISVVEVPPPLPGPGMALVQTAFSLISSGTESAFVSSGGAAGLAVKKALDPVMREKFKNRLATTGIRNTWELVRDKLFDSQAPGYGCSGIILEKAVDLPHFRPGDRVACAGVGYACHAEQNVIPAQLMTPIPEGVDLEDAAFVSLGAIACQGVRRINPSFGEVFIVSGLGLVGQLTLQVLKAAGCRVIASDPVPFRRDLAATLGADVIATPEELADLAFEHSAGYGVDGALICAATKDSGVVNEALRACRQKGRVIVVGAVGMNLERESLYLKELDFGLSCSYGPGRYQPPYEEEGLDYPLGHVRWTQGRNMSAFFQMIRSGQVQVKPLVQLRRPIDEAAEAYAAIQTDKEIIAALLEYPPSDKPADSPPWKRIYTLNSVAAKKDETVVSVLGAGSFASGVLLPALSRLPGCRLHSLACASGLHAQKRAKRFKAAAYSTDYKELLQDPTVDAVFIATRHHLHKAMALDAIAAGKHVFVEKPLALTTADCEEICEAAEKQGVLLSVGFNRRFAPLSLEAKKLFESTLGPEQLLYRCNAGALPGDHWALDPVQGGGRILGEAVHFFDYACWLFQDSPALIQAECLRPQQDNQPIDSLSVMIRFSQGSLATILYTGNGNSFLDKEYMEIHGHGKSVVIKDFKQLTPYGLGGKEIRKRRVDKGHSALLAHFIGAVQGRESLSVSGEDGLRATRIAETALQQAGISQKDRS